MGAEKFRVSYVERVERKKAAERLPVAAPDLSNDEKIEKYMGLFIKAYERMLLWPFMIAFFIFMIMQ